MITLKSAPGTLARAILDEEDTMALKADQELSLEDMTGR